MTSSARPQTADEHMLPKASERFRDLPDVVVGGWQHCVFLIRVKECDRAGDTHQDVILGGRYTPGREVSGVEYHVVHTNGPR